MDPDVRSRRIRDSEERREPMRSWSYRLLLVLAAAGALADKREAGEQMTGVPVTRATSTDGSWVYTLYQRPRAKPFVHALDAAHRAAVCIDLPWQGKQDEIMRLRL